MIGLERCSSFSFFKCFRSCFFYRFLTSGFASVVVCTTSFVTCRHKPKHPCTQLVFAYLRRKLKAVSFQAILILTFLIGVVAFLLPPVPGATVYIFGGVIVADQCPPQLGGFWGGALWNVLLCWVAQTGCLRNSTEDHRREVGQFLLHTSNNRRAHHSHAMC